MSNITASLAEMFPNEIWPNNDFVFINAGGWMGSYKMLYASTTEYILLFGTALDTSGHSGRYWADIHDFVLTGWGGCEAF